MTALFGQKFNYLRFLLNYRFWLHVTGWLAFFTSPLILPAPVFEHLPRFYVNYLFVTRVIINLVFIGIFYLNLFHLTPRLLWTRNLTRFLLYLAAMLVLVILLDYFLLKGVQEDLQKYFANTHAHDPFLESISADTFPSPHQLFANSLLFMLIILSSSLWAVLTDRLRQQAFSQQILYEKTSAELAVLRLQISPHFLFNTLNNIRWLTRTKSDQAEVSVMELAEILRYMLFQVTHHKVDLKEEITYLNRYVNLQKLRIHAKTEVDFNCDGDYENIKIEPLLFMPFVENAFKFGVHSEQPSKITIHLSVKENELLFICSNQCFDLSNDEQMPGTGQGLPNVKRRLELYYPLTHALTIHHDQSLFSVILKLSLNYGQNEMSGRR
ncbi:histidine kinase [Dyadobacter chenwenxiniae]|uniref:Histidine kinase n=1 Tax=Dyadobacter chenwenxiniae TaxID=2906456 RepID=A0A9X1TC21_9BACT|nr:histidine kinase [Dyadobacter chenwenxiniae]MCF0060461.1 histidine kinase [Dyadobacter chenwenxiniae]UON86193.1 histidine kinase [Dyadobacter chenwenxiniae]